MHLVEGDSGHSSLLLNLNCHNYSLLTLSDCPIPRLFFRLHKHQLMRPDNSSKQLKATSFKLGKELSIECTFSVRSFQCSLALVL